MLPTVRRTAPHLFVSRQFSTSEHFHRLLMAALWILAALFLLVSIGARAQTISFNGQQTTVPATGLHSPRGVAVDSAGDVYIGDLYNARVVEVSASGVQTAVPATGLANPFGVAVDGAGDIFIADSGNARVVELPAGGGPQTTLPATGLVTPYGVAVDGAGDVYIADYGNNQVVELPWTGSTYGGQTTTVGSGLKNPLGVAVDGAGDLYIADYNNNRVVEVPAGGGAQVTVGSGISGPTGVAVDGAGNVYIAEGSNNRVVEVTAGGTQTTLAATGLSYPAGLAVDGVGNVYISNANSNSVVELAQSVNFDSPAVGSLGTANQQSLVYTFQSADTLTAINVTTQGASGKDYTSGAGTTCVTNYSYLAGATCTVQVNLAPAFPGVRAGAVQLADSTGTQVTTYLRANATGPLGVFQPGTQTTSPIGGLNGPNNIAVDAVGNVYVADTGNARVVKTTPSGTQTTVGTGLIYPTGVALDGAGNVYIADQGTNGQNNGKIAVVTPGGTQRALPATDLSYPGLAIVDSMGNVYILNGGDDTVLKVTPDGAQTTMPVANLGCATDLAVDAAGDVYIADGCNSDVLEVTPSGTQTTLAATGLTVPVGVAVDAAGDVYIADAVNNNVVEVTPSGIQTTISSTGLNGPADLVLDSAGNVYVSDFSNNRIVELAPSAPSLSFASTNVGTTSTDSPQTVTMQNIGNQPLTFTGVTATANFNLNGAGTTCSNSSSLTPSTSCGLGIEFAPIAGGALAGTANLTDNNLNGSGAVQQVSLSGAGVVVVVEAPTTTTLTSSASSIIAGQSVAFTATVASAAGTPTGTVTFYNGTKSIGNGMLNNGVATLTTTTLTAGGDPAFTASYGGTASYATSISSTVTVTVSVAPVTPGYTLAANPSTLTIQAGQTSATVVTVTPVGGYSGTVTLGCSNMPANATCTFMQNGVANSMVTLTGNNQPVETGLSIATNVNAQAMLKTTPSPLSPILPALAFWWPGSMAGLVFFGRKRKGLKAQRSFLQLCVLALVLSGLAIGISGCGGSSGSGSGSNITPAGTTVASVQAAAFGSTQSLKLTVIVTQ